MTESAERRAPSRLEPGDQVELLRRVAIRPEGVITCEPGDIGGYCRCCAATRC